MNIYNFEAIERIMHENGLPIPGGRGEEKLEKIIDIVCTHDMPKDARRQLRTLLSLG